MARRGGTVRYRCVVPSCTSETRFVAYDTQRERLEIERAEHYRSYRCPEHADPERYLTPNNLHNSAVLVATDQGSGRFWRREGATTCSSGLSHSAAHYAEADRFPAGTRLVLTAHIELPVPNPEEIP